MSIKRILCLFGRHSPAREMLKLAPEGIFEVWTKKVCYCERCGKILFIGHSPPFPSEENPFYEKIKGR